MKRIFKTISLTTLFSLGIIIFSMLGMQALQPLVEQQLNIHWNLTASANGLSGTNGGIMYVYIYPHQVAPAVTYVNNCTNATALTYGDINTTGGTSVPFGVLFDIVVKVRANVTFAYNTSNSSWYTGWIKTEITCVPLGIGALTAMTCARIGKNSQFMWCNFYITNGGAGYSIAHGQIVNITTIKYSAYY